MLTSFCKIACTAAVILLCAGAAQAAPLALMGVTRQGETCFIGGGENGLFEDAEQIVSKLAIDQVFTLVDLSGPFREVNAVGLPQLTETGDCEASYMVELALEDGQPGKYAVAMAGTTAQVRTALPPTIEIKQPDDTSRKILRDYLKAAGLPDAELSFKQILSVDLNRDGQQDLIINASRINEDQAAKGDYSVVLVKEGDAVIPVHSEIVNEVPENAPSLLTNRVVAIADIDGRGPYEMIVYSSFDYGAGWDVTTIVDGKPQKVLWCGCGG